MEASVFIARARQCNIERSLLSYLYEILQLSTAHVHFLRWLHNNLYNSTCVEELCGVVCDEGCRLLRYVGGPG